MHRLDRGGRGPRGGFGQPLHGGTGGRNRLAEVGAETTEQHRVGGDQVTAGVDPSRRLGQLIGRQLQVVGYHDSATAGKVPKGSSMAASPPDRSRRNHESPSGDCTTSRGRLP